MLEEEEKDKFELMKEENIFKETDFDILDLKKSMMSRYEKLGRTNNLLLAIMSFLINVRKLPTISLCPCVSK
jgi:hypothetical protein